MKQKKFLKAVGAALACAAVLIGALFSSCDNGLVEDSSPVQARFGNVQAGPPIPISSAADMAQIGVTLPLDGDYYLVADIVLSAWTPIGDATNPFTGTFTGANTPNNYKIIVTDFSSAAWAGEYIGIFGYVAHTGENPNAGYIHDLNVEIKVSQYLTKTSSFQYLGALVGYAEGATLQDITVTGEISYSNANRLYIGGIAGYLERASLVNTTASETTVEVNAASTAAVYSGGAVGYGDGATITGVSTTGDVSVATGTTNTSAGGVAGRSVGGTVSNSHALGDITIGLNSKATIYSGGLVGYASGGLITKSHAEGAVSASSDYPYAGGLVGYNYSKNQTTQSYASGSATAITNVAGAGFPYAGGLAGYNASNSLIQNCYSTGVVYSQSINATAWAGGIAASNARGSVIDSTYATGSVSVRVTESPIPNTPLDGGVAGGIVGYNYYEIATVKNSAALNSAVTALKASVNYVRRVAGKDDSDPQTAPGINNGLFNNYANLSMVLTPQPTTWDIGTSGLDGEDTLSSQPDSTFYSGTLGWNFTPTTGIWKKVDGTDPYPLLQWQ
jgi:hypothetical protein